MFIFPEVRKRSRKKNNPTRAFVARKKAVATLSSATRVECANCRASFTSQGCLNYHIRHNCGKMRQCTYCGIVLKRLQDMKYHFKKFHPTCPFEVSIFYSD